MQIGKIIEYNDSKEYSELNWKSYLSKWVTLFYVLLSVEFLAKEFNYTGKNEKYTHLRTTMISQIICMVVEE